MHRGSQNESKIKGATPVAVLSDLSTEEHLAIYYFRCTFETPSVLMDIHREFCSYLGEKVADRTIGALHALITKLQKDGRRKLTRHQLSCNCVGVDENCFAHLVTMATKNDKKDAMLIAVLLSDANVAAELVYMAQDLGQGIIELVDKVSANLIREQGKFESLKSWVSMRNYLQQLSDEQLKAILKDIP